MGVIMDFWNQPRNTLFLGLIFSLFVSPLTVCASEGWSKYDDYDGITMYRKEVPGNPILAYRGEGVLQAPIEKLLPVLLDTARKPQWMSRVRSAEVLREVSPFEKVEFVHVKTPWILKDREFIYKVKVSLDQLTRFATIHYESVQDPIRPESGDRVRAHIFSGDFNLKPTLDGKGTHVEAEVHADPRGSIPKWIVNIYQKRLPRESLEGLLTQVSKPEIVGHPLFLLRK